MCTKFYPNPDFSVGKQSMKAFHEEKRLKRLNLRSVPFDIQEDLVELISEYPQANIVVYCIL